MGWITVLGLGSVAALAASCTFDPAGRDAIFDDASVAPTDADSKPDALQAADAALVDAAPADAEIADAAASDAHVCPASFHVLPQTGHAYRVRHMPQTWFQAADACAMLGPGVHLVVIDDATELAALDGFVNASPVWIGVNDIDVEGQFVLVTGGPATFLPWAAGEPNDANGGEDCVELAGAGLNDDGCTKTWPSVCECE